MIVIADVDLGNVASVANMLRRLGYDPLVSREADPLTSATHVILPGVGAFDTGMTGLQKWGWPDALRSLDPEQSLLGICLGMQLLSEGSEEGQLPGLGLVPARFFKFDPAAVTVPHMGWNHIDVLRPSRILPDTGNGDRYYFTHSYYAQCREDRMILATASHGQPFIAAYGTGRIFGVQFHPEKSHRFGMRLLKNFVEG